jgi:DNA helicase II / ATP-dependent DNA helicase PcrA
MNLYRLRVFTKTDFGRVYRDYCAMLQRYRFLTYGQLITKAVDALKRREVFEAVHATRKYLFVDEYQDINPAQEELIRLLAKAPVNLCVVGDDDQSIYQWRGSDVSNIQKFTRRYPCAKVLTLSTNRRSRPGIIKAANQFAKSLRPRLKKRMGTKREAGGPELFCWAAENAEEESARIVETIQQLVLQGYRYQDIGILLRSVRTSSRPLLNALRTAGMPVECAGRTGLFQHPEINLLGMTYAWLADQKWCSESWGEGQRVRSAGLLRQYSTLFGLTSRRCDTLATRQQEWKAATKSEEDPANLVRDYYVLLRCLGVHLWNPPGSRCQRQTGNPSALFSALGGF